MDAKLEWVQRNRGRSRSWASAGSVVSALAGNLKREADTPAAAAAALLFEAADEDFRRHCRVEPGSGSVIIIHVDNPTLVSVMRGRWEGSLRRSLASAFQRHRIRDVRFRYGNSGIRLDRPMQ